MGVTYIYGIRDLEINKFIYVGKSNSPRSRYSKLEHSHNDCVREFVEKKGEDNFQIEPLETVQFKTSEEWVERERFWKLKLDEESHPLCNKNDGGGGSVAGWHHTDEAKAKMSKANLGENNPRGFLGKHHSEEWKCEFRKRMLGENHPRGMLGKHHTKESIVKMSGENHPGFGKIGYWHSRHRSKETKAKLKGNENNAKPYPAFYNVETGEYIPAGRNLTRLCREESLNFFTLYNLQQGNHQQSKDGWRLE